MERPLATSADRRERALDALAADDWPTAATLLADLLAADDDPELRLSLAVALWCQYDVDAALEQLKRAHRGFVDSGRPGRASWVACWIAWEEAAVHGRPSVAQGWFGRAAALLDGLQPSPESAWLRVWRAAFEGDPVVLAEASRHGVEIARQFGDRDLEMLSLAEEGVALVGLGRVREGMAALDQAMVGILAGEVRLPVVISDCFCAMLGACEQIGDVQRAEEWCETAMRTADAKAIGFLGASCHVTYGSLLASSGRYSEAEREIEAALQMFSGGHRHLRLDAFARLADIRRRQGRVAEARALIADAHGMGPALRVRTEIDLADRRPDRARESASRLLMRATSTAERATALALLARASAADGDRTSAATALVELEALADVGTPIVSGSLWLARGAVATVDQRFAEAAAAYREASDVFASAGMTHEAGEASAALAAVEASGVRSRDGRPGDVPLSARELEVLRLLATGSSNAAIARQLVVSEHTVHRHVANVLRKLDVPTRAAAVAAAGRRGLL